MDTMNLTIGGALILALNIYAIYNVLSSRAGALSKVLWMVFILLLPILGFIAWLIFGPRSRG